MNSRLTTLQKASKWIAKRLSKAPRQPHWDPYLLLLLGLSLLALTPLWAPGYFYEAHDGRHSVFYLMMFDASLRDGALWPRWAMHHNQGYGYPTFIIQAPLGFYLGELFVLLGAGFTQAAKWAWTTGFLAGAWGMYALVRHWLCTTPVSRALTVSGKDGARLAALVAGLLYVFIPYHLLDIYVRAALNDTLLLGWFPWVVLAFDRLILAGMRVGWRNRLVVAAFALAGVLLTHTFALVSFLPLLLSFILFRLLWSWLNDARRWRPLLWRTLLTATSGIAALSIFSVFLIPLLVEGHYLQQQVFVGNTYDFHRHFVYWGQFFSPFWGFGYSDDPSGANDGMSFQIGLAALLLGAVGGYLVCQCRRRRAILSYLLATTLGLMFVMSPWTAPLWDLLPALAVIQFPWRLLGLTAFTLSAVAGLAVAELRRTEPRGIEELWLIVVLVILSSAPYVAAPLQPVEPWREDGRAIFEFEQEHPDMYGYTQWVTEPFSTTPLTAAYRDPAYRENHGVTDSLPRLEIVQGQGEVLSNYSRGSSFGGTVRMTSAGIVRILVYYFPGWRATIDGISAPYRHSGRQGLIELDVPAGTHRIDLRMGATPPRRLGTLLAWGTVVVLLGLAAWPMRETGAALTHGE